MIVKTCARKCVVGLHFKIIKFPIQVVMSNKGPGNQELKYLPLVSNSTSNGASAPRFSHQVDQVISESKHSGDVGTDIGLYLSDAEVSGY